MKRVLPFLFTALVVSAVFALVALMTTHRGEAIRSEMATLGKKVTEVAAEELDEAADKLEEVAEKL
jgi:ribosomal protein S20